MSPEDASLKKIAGHVNEYDFADIIGGEVNLGSQLDKKDVLDPQHRSHSVKGGSWWQIFLYSRNRLETNTILQGIGNIAPVMIRCLDSFPEKFQDYDNDKITAKTALQAPMRELCLELQKPNIMPAFISKAMFNGGEVNYLSVLPIHIPTESEKEIKIFHVFDQTDVVSVLSADLQIANSRARNRNEMDDQKVILRFAERNVGEIEVRSDKSNYRRMKLRLNSSRMYSLLTSRIDPRELKSPKVFAYGNATRTFNI